MYSEYLFLVLDYFRTLKWKYFIYEWFVPLIISTGIYFILKDKDISDLSDEFFNSSVSLLGVLVGFSITVITILVTTSSANIDEIKKTYTEYKIGKDFITLFKLFLINLTYSVVAEITILIFNLILPVVSNRLGNTSLTVLMVLDILLIVHILLLTIRNMTDFYFILFKESEADEN